jgi:hypothetical protein
MMKTNNKKKGNTAKKLIPAAMMLAVSASMLATSTYAWFSMNKEVSVTSMAIAAKSADPIIEISANGTDFYNSLTTAGTPNWELPSSTGVALKLVTPTAISTASGSEGTVSWGWAASTAHNNAQVANATTAKALTAQSTPAKTESNRAAYLGDCTDLYVMKQKLTIRNVSPDVIANNLVINQVQINKGSNTIANAVRVLFVSETGEYALYEPAASGTGFVDATQVTTGNHQWLAAANSTQMTAGANGPTVASTLAANGGDVDVDVYVFFDGTDTDAYTDLATNLGDVSVQFGFAID